MFGGGEARLALARHADHLGDAMRKGLQGCGVTIAVSVAMAVSAGPSVAAAATVECAGTIGPGTIAGNLVAQSGCEVVEGTTIDGNIKVTGGDFSAHGITITGSFNAHGAGSVLLESSNVGGDVLIGDSREVTIAGNEATVSTIGGTVSIRHDSVPPFVAFLRVGGNVSITDNISTQLPQGAYFWGITGVETPGVVLVQGNKGSGVGAALLGFGVTGVTARTLRVTHNSLVNEEPPSLRYPLDGILQVQGNQVSGNLVFSFNEAQEGGPDLFAYNSAGGTIICRHNRLVGDGTPEQDPGNTAARFVFNFFEC
jgi:hypothetical protein